MSSIDWSLLPNDVVAISMYSDFSGGASLILNDKGELISYCDPCGGSCDVIVAVNPKHSVEVVSVLNRKNERLLSEIRCLKEKLILASKV